MRWLVAALLALVLTSCGGDDGGGAGGEDNPDASAIAKDIESQVDSVTKTVEITEDNDPNDLIGRPGGYEQAVSIYDSRATCDSELDITCGAKVEVFATEAGAKDRRDYLVNIVSQTGGLLSEYDYLDGVVLLRVNGQLKPSEAEEYEAALKD
jgi:hypothetical protein